MKRIANLIIGALCALTLSACGGATILAPSDVPNSESGPSTPPEWSQPNPLADPTSGNSTGVTVALLSFSPPRGSRITPTVGFPPIGGDMCAENRCFKFEAELCNRTEWRKYFKFFWSADGVTTLPGNQVVTGGVIVGAGQCVIKGNGNLSLFFPLGARQMIVSVAPSEMPGWNDSWPRFSFNLQYTN